MGCASGGAAWLICYRSRELDKPPYPRGSGCAPSRADVMSALREGPWHIIAAQRWLHGPRISQPQSLSRVRHERNDALRPALAQSQDLASLTLKQASDVLRRRAASAVELTQACLKRIETYNPALNAFITVTAEQALTVARQMDAEQREGIGVGRFTAYRSPSRTTWIPRASERRQQVSCLSTGFRESDRRARLFSAVSRFHVRISRLRRQRGP